MLKAIQPVITSEQEAPAATDPSLGELVETGLGFLRRHYAIILLALILAVAMAIVYIVTTPKLFTAQADLLIDTRKINVSQQPPVLGEMNFDAIAMETQLQLLKSHNLALAVINNLDLTKDPELTGSISEPKSLYKDFLSKVPFLAPKETTPSNIQLSEIVLRAFQKRLAVNRAGGTVIAIQFSSADPQRAAEIANAVGDTYIANQLDVRRQAAKRAVAWLQDRLPELRSQASAAEHAVIDFKTKNNIVAADGKMMNELQITALNSELVAAHSRTSEARARLDRIEAVLAADALGSKTIATVTDTLSNPIIIQLRTKYLDYVNREAYISARYGRDHLVAVKLRREIADVQRAMLDEFHRIAESYKSEYEIAKQREAALKNSLDEKVAQSRTTDQAQVALRELDSSARQYQALQDAYIKRYVEVVQQESLPITEAQFISRASPPLTSNSSKSHLILAFAALGGIVFGAGIAVLRESMDRVFRTGKQVANTLGTDCIALLPILKRNQPMKSLSKNEWSDARTIIPNANNSAIWTVINSPFSLYSESIRSLKLSLNEGVKSNKVLGFTSALPGEGKSTVAGSLALLAAKTGARVILVDCDLRNASLSSLLAASTAAGIADVIDGNASLNNTIWTEPSTNLTFLPAGVASQLAHSNEVLASEAIKGLFDQLRRHYDYIIVDLPPLAPIVDVRAAAEFVDLYTLIIEWGRTRIDLVEHALAEARVVHENLHGVVLNKVDFNLLTRYEGAGSKNYRKQYVAYGSCGMSSDHRRPVLFGG